MHKDMTPQISEIDDEVFKQEKKIGSIDLKEIQKFVTDSLTSDSGFYVLLYKCFFF